ncbi:MAG: hypothetical protein Q7S27_07375 [Nanoarchaeota archaeon]|nr:hypothetical protein [Nanoarchaeota archaeon]
MGLTKRADGVIFADVELERNFNSLSEEDWLKKALRKAIVDLKENIFTGENIRKKLIPKHYKKKYNIDNLWWYPLPNGWRLIYSVITPNNREILALILEYFNHTNYERRFGY